MIIMNKDISLEPTSENARVIAKSNDLYVIVNNQTDKISDFFALGKVIDKTGKEYTSWIPLGTIFRDETWEEIDIPYTEFITTKKPTAVDGLLGSAIGDALGVPVEFLSRQKVRKIGLKDMLGSDTYRNFHSRWGRIIPSGAWSDDTSMLIASMDSLADNKAQANYDDLMNRYLNWWERGDYASLKTPFGLGSCVAQALNNYIRGASALESGAKGFRNNGNGSLMRIFPFSMYCIENNLSEEETCEYISNASKITHAHEISQMSCFIYTEFLRSIIETKNPEMAFMHIREIDYLKYFDREIVLAFSQLLNPAFINITDDQIKSSGYVIDTLESVIYSVLNGTNYEDTVLKAINLGYDTDTIGGITGSIAGMLYGMESIPKRWLDKVKRKDYLIQLATKFDKVLKENKVPKKTDLEI